jgi:hypothetical protein
LVILNLRYCRGNFPNRAFVEDAGIGGEELAEHMGYSHDSVTPTTCFEAELKVRKKNFREIF